ncbi:MAG TPA: M23 family metallopeptidase [Gemmatimonadaceae bacterium]|nr:M23 family metallopeptidase [Gemmatimonadaceae bacterium]
MIRYYPIAGAPRNICAGYGNRTTNGVTKLHDACDLCAPTGTPVVACDDGTVSYGVDPTGGNVAILHIADGTAYFHAHLLDVQTGQRKVSAGQQIARVDTTGNAALVGIPHCHWQIWPGGTFQPGTVHPDPTAALLAAEVLSAPLSGGIGVASKALLYALGFATAVGLTYGALYAWDRRQA